MALDNHIYSAADNAQAPDLTDFAQIVRPPSFLHIILRLRVPNFAIQTIRVPE